MSCPNTVCTVPVAVAPPAETIWFPYILSFILSLLLLLTFYYSGIHQQLPLKVELVQIALEFMHICEKIDQLSQGENRIDTVAAGQEVGAELRDELLFVELFAV